mmetsp:Transcript_44013/g.79126  ORF Transcript_44013/g.79126 Transcript_44013/m.79126 type:complete len:286 (+) Transcript_44013:2403-3260(+)
MDFFNWESSTRWNFHDFGSREVVDEGRHVQRSAHEHNPQVIALFHDPFEENEGKIGHETTVMDLIENNDVEANQHRIANQSLEENSGGAVSYSASVTICSYGVATNRVADLTSRFCKALIRNSLGQGRGCKPSWLSDKDTGFLPHPVRWSWADSFCHVHFPFFIFAFVVFHSNLSPILVDLKDLASVPFWWSVDLFPLFLFFSFFFCLLFFLLLFCSFFSFFSLFTFWLDFFGIRHFDRSSNFQFQFQLWHFTLCLPLAEVVQDVLRNLCGFATSSTTADDHTLV